MARRARAGPLPAGRPATASAGRPDRPDRRGGRRTSRRRGRLSRRGDALSLRARRTLRGAAALAHARAPRPRAFRGAGRAADGGGGRAFMPREVFITPMAAVAGSVADEILAVMRRRRRTGLARIWSTTAATSRSISRPARRRRSASSAGPTVRRCSRAHASRRGTESAASPHRARRAQLLARHRRRGHDPCAATPRKPTPPRRSSPTRSIFPAIRASSARRRASLQPDSDLGDRLVTRSVRRARLRSRSRRRSTAALAPPGRSSRGA